MRRPLLAPALLALVAVSACGGPDVEYGEPLVEGVGKPTIVKLDDVRLALTRTDEHTLVAQWGDGDSWTVPDEVHHDAKLTVGELKVESAGRTVAVGLDLSDPTNPDEEAGPAVTALVVCHDFACEDSRTGEMLSSPQVDGEGSTVAFPIDRSRMLLWRKDDGFTTTTLQDIPAESRVLLLSDGAVVAASARKVDGGCRYEMHVADDDLAFSRAATTPTMGGLCGLAAAEVKGEDRVEIHDEGSSDEIAFVRDGDEWTADVPESPAMGYPDTGGRESIAPVGGSIGGSEDEPGTSVLLGSPDGRRIMIQWRAPGEKEWSRPSQVATAPGATRCGFADTGAAGEGIVYLVRCHLPGGPHESTDPADTALVLTSGDALSWTETELEQGFALKSDVTAGTTLVAGSQEVLYFHDDPEAPDRARLPLVPGQDDVALDSTGDLVRISCHGGPGEAWRPTYSFAELTATSWGPSRPLPGVPDEVAAQEEPCSALVWAEAEYLNVSVSGAATESPALGFERSYTRAGDRLVPQGP